MQLYEVQEMKFEAAKEWMEKLIKLLACSTRCKFKIIDVLWLLLGNLSTDFYSAWFEMEAEKNLN